MIKTVDYILFVICWTCILSSCQDEDPNMDKYSSPDSNIEKVSAHYYIEERLCLYDKDLCKKNDCIILSIDTIVPNYYLIYKNTQYRMDSYLYTQSEISFDYDIFQSPDSNCSFILFYGQNKRGNYKYCKLKLVGDSLKVTEYYRVQVHSFEGELLEDDKVASLIGGEFIADGKDFFNKEFRFPGQDDFRFNNHLLRNGRWTKKHRSKTELCIMRHFEFISCCNSKKDKI